MAVRIVDGFEVIDVEDHQGQRLLAVDRTLDHLAEVRFEEAPVVQPGQRVDHGKLQGFLHDVAQAIGVALAPQLNAHPRHQLVPIDGTGDIVVHADIERAQDPGAIVRVGQQEDRQFARSLQRPELAAQA